MKSIKNLMSDRCIIEKKFNELLQTYRQSILTHVVQGWSDLSEDQRSGVVRMNDFFCGLHFIVGLADQAEAALKIWDKLLYFDEKVATLGHGCYRKKEDQGLCAWLEQCVRLFRL